MTHLGNLLSAVVDGELTGAELDRANAHLAACAACRGEAHAVRQLKQHLRALAADVTVPGDITDRLLAISATRTAEAGDSQGNRTAAPGGQVSTRLLSGPAGPRRRRRAGPRLPAAARRPGRAVPAERRRGRQVLWGALSIMVVGIGGAAFGLGGAGPSGPAIEPQLGVFGLQHAAMSGLPFSGLPGLVPLTGRIRAA